jgi:hypothetical protein
VLFVFHEWRLLRRELLEHPGDGRGTDAKTMSKRVARDAFFFGAFELQDRFQIIVYRLRVIKSHRFKVTPCAII